MAQGRLTVRNDLENPLASIEDIKNLGNSGGGDLGDLLVSFASGNHALMRGDSGRLDASVPSGLFSLEFPGSQGSHAGHSGILQGNPEMLDSGRLSESDFARLTSRSKDGWIKRSEVGSFISENLLKDRKAKVFGKHTAELLGSDLSEFAETTGSALLGTLFRSDEEAHSTHRDIEAKLTKLLGEDNLVGSAGEFGLLFALLTHRPGARTIDGEPAVAVEDLKRMFVDKQLPAGWEAWKKSRADWVRHTMGLLISAAKEYKRVRFGVSSAS